MPDIPRVLLHNDDTTGLAARLHAAFPDISLAECNSYAALPDMIDSFRPDVVYTVRFAGTQGYPRDALFGANGPQWIANGGAGTDHFGLWNPDQTTVTNAAGVAADMMAEYVIGGFLHFTLDISGLQADKSARLWQARTVRSLKDQTLLIVGLGHTGKAIAARARAFGMRIVGTRATPRPMENVDHVAAAADLPMLLPDADFIAVCTPLTKKTRGMIGAAEIAAMKPGVVFADVSRGGVTDQITLLRALRGGQIAGAALDVFETEPLPESSPLWQLENVIISPHCSSVYEGWAMASFELFLTNLENFRSRRSLLNIVDPIRGY